MKQGLPKVHILFVSMAIAVLVAGGFLWYSLFKDKDDFGGTSASSESSSGELLAECEQIEMIGLKYDCYIEIAGKNKDLEICDLVLSIEDAIIPQERNWRCLKEVAVATEDVSICDIIEHSQIMDACYAEIIQKTGNFELCEHFSSRPTLGPSECWVFDI